MTRQLDIYRLLSKLVKGSGTKPGEGLDAAAMTLLTGESICDCDLLRRGRARSGRTLTEHMPLQLAIAHWI